MRKRLCIGIQSLTLNWQIVLDQLGIWYEELNYSESLSEQYSVIILNEKPDFNQMRHIQSYLDEGGSILETIDVHALVISHQSSQKKVKGIINTSDSNTFEHIPFLDIYHTAAFHRDSELFEGLIHFEKQKNGWVGFLGLDIPGLLQHTGYTRKRFYSESGPFPDEIVSRTSKKQFSDFLDAILKELHLKQDIPYIQKWTSPSEKPIFGFRIDSDYGDRESINNLYKVLNKHEVPATWFLHVEAHEAWLNHFHTFNNQEIALHGYEHGTSESISKTQENIRKGKYLLEQAKFKPNGFCAPYGIWNTALYRSLKAFDFLYTSEFTFAHDGYPIQPLGPDMPLQIPIHPICTGSMYRQHYSTEQMISYFKQTLKRKLGRFEPVIFYHHPLQPGLEVLDHLFEEINHHKLTKLSFIDISKFWENRRKFNFNAFYEGQKLLLNSDSDTDVFLQVSNSHKQFYLMRNHSGESSISDMQKYEYSNCYLPSSDDAETMNRTDLRIIKTSLFDWKNRIKL